MLNDNDPKDGGNGRDTITSESEARHQGGQQQQQGGKQDIEFAVHGDSGLAGNSVSGLNSDDGNVTGTGAGVGMQISMDYTSMGGDLLLLAITSLFVFIQAAASCESSDTCATASTQQNKTLTSYAIAVGLVSAILCVGALIISKLCVLQDRARMYLLAFLFVWWVVAAALLTFGGPLEFVTVSNGYFCTWASLLLSGYALHKEASTFKGAVDNMTSKMASSPEEIRYLYLIILASAVVVFSAIQPCMALCGGTPGFAIAVGGISVLEALFLRFQKRRIGGKVGILSIVMVILWGLAAAILTFKGPFTFVGNGYFASYGAFVAWALYMKQNI